VRKVFLLLLTAGLGYVLYLRLGPEDGWTDAA